MVQADNRANFSPWPLIGDFIVYIKFTVAYKNVSSLQYHYKYNSNEDSKLN